MNLKTFFFTFFVIQLFALSCFASSVTCNRDSDDTHGFTTRKALDWWFPKTQEITASQFEEKGGGSKQLKWFSSGQSGIAGQSKVIWYLLPNGKMIAHKKSAPGIISVKRRYSCDKTSIEVRNLISSGQSTIVTLSDGTQRSFPVAFQHSTGNSRIYFGEGMIFYSSKGKHFDKFVNYVNDGTPIEFGLGRFNGKCTDIRSDVKHLETSAKIVKTESNRQGILLTNYDYRAGDFFEGLVGSKFALFLSSLWPQIAFEGTLGPRTLLLIF
ncbi:hypothetical protein AB8878_09045 [Alphaproteobacteria bacterium LSUCC0226]